MASDTRRSPRSWRRATAQPRPGWEIGEWLRLHPEVSSFAILDDCSDMARLRHRLVLVDPVVGLDDPDVERARRFLMAADGDERL